MKERLRTILPNGFRQLIKYGLIGILNVAIYWSIFEIMTRIYDVHYLYANTIASIVSFFNGLYFNRRWTFRSQTHWLRDASYFVVIFMACFIVQSGTLVVCVERFGMDPQLAKYIGIVVFALLNFTLNKYVTFRKKKII